MRKTYALAEVLVSHSFRPGSREINAMPQTSTPHSFLLIGSSVTEGWREAWTINPATDLGAPHVGFTCGGFDFSAIVSLRSRNRCGNRRAARGMCENEPK